MDWTQEPLDTGTLTGFSGCDMSAHYYNEEGTEMCWVQAITWVPHVDKDHNFHGYLGSLVFCENIYEEPIVPPKRFWIKVLAYREPRGSLPVMMTFHHVELLEPFVGYDKAYKFKAQSKTKFIPQGE